MKFIETTKNYFKCMEELKVLGAKKKKEGLSEEENARIEELVTELNQNQKEMSQTYLVGLLIFAVVFGGIAALTGNLDSSSSSDDPYARVRCFKACEEMERAATNDRSKYGYSFNQTECMDKCRRKHP